MTGRVVSQDVASIETEAVERALDVLLRAMIDEDGKRVPNVDCTVVFLASNLQHMKLPTRTEMDVKAIVDEPVRAACKQAVRKLGEHLFKALGNTEAMSDLLERVADMDPPRYSYRAGIMDKAWDGIGNERDRWWA